MLDCEPEVTLWSNLGAGQGVFSQSRPHAVVGEVLRRGPGRERLGRLGEKGEEVPIDGDWPRWRGMMIAAGWVWGRGEEVSWKELRWILEESALQEYGMG